MVAHISWHTFHLLQTYGSPSTLYFCHSLFLGTWKQEELTRRVYYGETLTSNHCSNDEKQKDASKFEAGQILDVQEAREKAEDVHIRAML